MTIKTTNNKIFGVIKLVWKIKARWISSINKNFNKKNLITILLELIIIGIGNPINSQWLKIKFYNYSHKYKKLNNYKI